jgi:hypothetical protein
VRENEFKDPGFDPQSGKTVNFKVSLKVGVEWLISRQLAILHCENARVNVP